ncbi:MAG: ankyrin repeat domain-containing protein [Myxococcales bacterium]|nr:ankyrin repeat domain-containing protein [Myxococcales bacterium]
MLPLRSPAEVLYVDDVLVERDPGGWAFSWSERDVNSLIDHRIVRTTDEVIASGPVGRMTAAELDALARAVEREPSSLRWCRERRLLECIVADDLDAALVVLPSKTPMTARINDVSEPILTIALGVAAWKVAADLILRGERLAPPAGTSWDAASYAIAALDDSDGAAVVLQHLLARGAFVPAGGHLRQVRSPRIVHALIDAGADPDGSRPSSATLGGFLDDGTPIAVAVVQGRLEVADALIQRGASLEARDPHGRTALILAAAWGFEGPVRWLLDRGADVACAADAQGRTPRSIALETPDDPCSRLLLGR